MTAGKFNMWQTTSGKFHRNFEGDPEKFSQTEHKLAPDNQLISYIDEAQFPPNAALKEMPMSIFRTSNDLRIDHELGSYLAEVRHIADLRNSNIQTVAESLKNSPYLTNNDSTMQTTSSTIHRRFSTDETGRNYPPNHATYWTCEEYPKGWGFGVTRNPLPKITNRSVDMNRDPELDLANGHVSRLTVEIPTNNHQNEKITQSAPCSGPPLPTKSKYAERYNKIPAVEKNDLYNVPMMYRTLNKTYGGE